MTRVAEPLEQEPAAPGGLAAVRRAAVTRYVAAFEQFDRSVAAGQPDWLVGARRGAIARFRELGFPTTKQEAWRFTSVAPIEAQATPLAGEGLSALGGGARRWLAPEQAAAVAVLVNGRYAPELSNLAALPAGVSVSSLKAARRTHAALVERHLTLGAGPATTHPFVALNTAFLDDGLFVWLPPQTVLAAPLHLVCLSTGQAGATAVSHPRVLLLAGERSEVQVVERYEAGADRPYFTNAVTEIVAEPGAVVDHYRVQQEAAGAFHLGSLYVRAGHASTFSSHSFSFGGQLVRNDVVATLDGEGVACTLNGLYLAGGDALVDTHTTIDHARPHCASREVYKGILWGRARAVFNGKILVRPDAQKTDAKQTNKTLLLSDEAQINTKPELEIFADDVKCTHGAAVGQLDEDALFYLRARGLTPEVAHAMLVRAFAGEVIHGVKAAALRGELESVLAARLRQASV